MKRKITITCAIFSVAFFLGWAVSPWAIKAWLEHKYPFLDIGKVSLTWKGLDIHQVSVNTPSIQGSEISLQITKEQEVILKKGKLTIKKNGGSETPISDVKVTRGLKIQGYLDTVLYDTEDTLFEAQHVVLSEDRVCALQVRISGYLGDLDLQQTCGDRKTKEAWVSSGSWRYVVDIPPILQAYLPSTLEFQEVYFNREVNSAHIGSFQAGPFQGIGVEVLLQKQEVSLSLETLSGKQVPLTSEFVTFRNLTGHITPGKMEWDLNGLPLTLGLISKELHIEGSCQTWLNSLPVELRVGPLKNLQMVGSLKLHITQNPPLFSLNTSCQPVSCTPYQDLRHAVTYQAYHPDNTRFERVVGPATPYWVPFSSFGVHFPQAVIQAEDPGYQGHQGISTKALENAFVDDIKQGKFHRGGSTIPMQLAKNLWLSRDKTLARKGQEMFLALGLNKCFSKEEILTLYLNVVEFGPDIYGAEQGAKHYFKKSVGKLDPIEATWLAHILPAPKKAGTPPKPSLQGISLEGWDLN